MKLLGQTPSREELNKIIEEVDVDSKYGNLSDSQIGSPCGDTMLKAVFFSIGLSPVAGLNFLKVIS